MRTLAFIILPVAIGACSQGAASIEAAMAEHNVPGLAFATLENCELDTVAVHGMADIDQPVTDSTVFEAASLTKLVFAQLYLEAAGEGLIDLDQPVLEVVDYPRASGLSGFDSVTPRQLLSHRAGLANWSGDPVDPGRDTPLELVATPGEAFSYSGEGYALLQAHLEAVRGAGFEALFQARFGEIMPASAVGPELDESHPKARGFDEDGLAGESRDFFPIPQAHAAYSLRTTIKDFGRFLSEACSGYRLAEPVRSDMLTPQSPTSSEAVSWGLGWGVLTTEDRVVHLQWGDNYQFRAFTGFDPASGDGFVMLTNGAGGLELMEQLGDDEIGPLAAFKAWLDE